MACTSCFDNEQKIDEINAENISNIIFQEKYNTHVHHKIEMVVWGKWICYQMEEKEKNLFFKYVLHFVFW